MSTVIHLVNNHKITTVQLVFDFDFGEIKRSHIEYMYTGIYCALMSGQFDSIRVVYFNRSQFFKISSTIKSHEKLCFFVPSTM